MWTASASSATNARSVVCVALPADDRAADDDAVGDPGDRGGLLGRRDAESDGDGQCGRGLHARDELRELGGQLGALAVTPVVDTQ